MKKSLFHYELPEQLIAKRPLENRSGSRLLVLEGESTHHRHFKDLTDTLKPGDLLVFNNTRVVPARLFGKKETGGAVEVMVERLLSNEHEKRVRAQLRASKSPKVGSEIIL